MSKDLFLSELRKKLTVLSQDEQEQIIEEYISIFEIRSDEGIDEQTIIEQLGDPSTIAQEFISELGQSKNNNEQKNYSDEQFNNDNRNVPLFILMLIFSLLIGGWLLFAAVITLFTFGVTGLAIFISSFAFIGVQSVLASIASVFLLLGIGLLMMLLCAVLARLLFKGLVGYIRWLKSLL